MNRLLLKECLDELRSDDLEELTEAHNNRQKKRNGPRRPNTQIATSGPSKPTSRKQPHRKPTTLIDSKAGQELASLAATIAREGAKSPEDFLNELSTAVGRPMTVADNSKYFSNFNTGTSLWLRIANHRATARWFFENGHPINNFGIVIKLVNKRFVPDKRVQYQEEVFFKEDLNADMEIRIVKGLVDWISTGRYTGPVGNETCYSPSGKVVRHSRKPQPQSIPQPPPPQPPAPPPDEPGVKESLTKYFQGTHDMKFRLLKEAALRELMEEDLNRYEMAWSDADKGWMVVYAHDMREAEGKFEDGEYEIEIPGEDYDEEYVIDKNGKRVEENDTVRAIDPETGEEDIFEVTTIDGDMVELCNDRTGFETKPSEIELVVTPRTE